MSKKVIILIIGVIVLLGVGVVYIRQSDNVIENVENFRMSYRREGGYSPGYEGVSIVGNEAKISFDIYPNKQVVAERTLPADFVKTLVKKYQEMDFFNVDVKSRLVLDAGRTTIYFQINGKSRTISYVDTDNKKIKELVLMYSRIISQERYLLQFKDYQKKDKGEVASNLSGLSADIRDRRILDSSEFIPMLKDILSDEEQRESLGQYAIWCLEEISKKEYGRDYNKWLEWIEENY